MKKYKWMFFLILFIVLLGEALKTVIKLIFKILIDEGTNFANGLITTETFIQILIILALVHFGSTIIRTIKSWFHFHLINRLDHALILDVKKKYFNHIIHLSNKFHNNHKTGSLISKMVRGAGAVESLTDILTFNMAPLVFQLVVAFLSIIYFDSTSAIVVALTVVFFIAYSFLLQKKQEPYNLDATKSQDKEKANLSDMLTNVDSIKYFGKESLIKRKYEKLAKTTRLAQIIRWDFYRWLSAGQALILGVGTIFLLYCPLIKFIEGSITLGSLVFIYTVFGNLAFPLYSFANGLRNFYRATSDVQALFAYSKITNEIKDKQGAINCKIKDNSISFKNLSFKYNKRTVVKNFNLEIKQNEKVALVGHSGSGKTTLLKLLYRFYDSTEGDILVGKKNIKDFKQESLRSELSIVPQECILFDDTIYNNIKFSNPSAKRSEVIKAMRFARLDKLVRRLPDKEKTIVGERGVKLSGGEKQRVSIARAILANKKILVLDEATSALDSQTEHEIQQDLEKLMKGRTSIIIAHRLSTIMKADKIVVMEKGKIVQVGTHRQLSIKPGIYRRMWKLQKGGFIK